jgi:hypothetical protein
MSKKMMPVAGIDLFSYFVLSFNRFFEDEEDFSEKIR